MERDVEIECTCGEVHGIARGVSERNVNRATCYCADCQTFAHHLGRADLLDAQGGSEIVQVAPSTLSFDRGTARIAAIRLGPKGLYRWHATCCKTPLGNTVEPKLPFVGIVVHAFAEARDPARRDAIFGPTMGAINGKDAVGEPPPGSVKMSPVLLAKTVRRILGWKLRGKTWPHPFFDQATGAPRYPVTILSREQRDAARQHAGPRPA